jgi:hypothetical protein
MSLNIYLNTVPEDAGGATRFLKEEGDEWEVISATQPVLGTGVIFRDDVWHDGAPVFSGEKFLLRTDIMYGRVKGLDFEGVGLSGRLFPVPFLFRLKSVNYLEGDEEMAS